MSDCKGFAGQLFGHAYAPVFESKPSGSTLRTILGDGMELKGHGAADIISKLADACVTRAYLGHVCARCGDRIYT